MDNKFGNKRSIWGNSGWYLIWFLIWNTLGFLLVFWMWHYQGGTLRKFEPVNFLIWYIGSILFAYVTGRSSIRLERLRRAAEHVNLRDLKVHVPVEGRDSVAELAKSFNQMVDRLESQERARRQFFADVAHELRHPIAALMGRLESIQDGVLPLNNEQILLLQDVAIGLKRLVSDINDLSLAEVGQLTLHFSFVDVSELTEQIQGYLEPVSEDLGISFSASVEKNIPLLYADRDRVRQILFNLINNALHYTSPNGYVELKVWRESDEVIFRVTDSGRGIDPSDLPHIFERFFRADKSRSRAKGGSGLGLAIVKSFVELQGGTVHVESSLEKGSKFTVRLPLFKKSERK